MHLDRRSILRYAVCGCIAVAHSPLKALAVQNPTDDLDVLAAVLRAQVSPGAKHPLLIASTPFSTGPMTVLSTPPTPMKKVTHQVELPYLVPPVERLAEAIAISDAYNQSLQHPATPIVETQAFTFSHRLLKDEVVAQFEALYPGGNVYSEELERKRRVVSSRYRLYFDGSTTLWRVSRVAFASGGTLAVIGLRSSGGSCSSESWQVLERFGDKWHSLLWGGGLLTCA